MSEEKWFAWWYPSENYSLETNSSSLEIDIFKNFWTDEI
jgi:hypothetical protein